MREIVVLCGAEADLLGIYCWLEALSTELADRFDAAAQDCLSALAEQPLMAPVFRGDYRRMLIAGFNCFGIFYTLEGSKRVCVAAVLDLRQDPGIILRRLGLT